MKEEEFNEDIELTSQDEESLARMRESGVFSSGIEGGEKRAP